MNYLALLALCLAAFAASDALKIHRITHSNNEVDESGIYQRTDLGEDAEEEEEVYSKRLAGPVSCGRAPNPPPVNANMTSVLKTSYNVGDVISYKCAQSYMRVIEGSLSVSCQSGGTWSPLPVCQSYSHTCRSTKTAREYRGFVNKTRCGKPCQSWAVSKTAPSFPVDVANGLANPAMFPEYRNAYDASNNCRNPDPNEKVGPWCYINNGPVSANRPWGYCDVTYCDAFDQFDEYDRIPGACGCKGEWYNAISNYGNIKSLEGATIQACKAECDTNAQCLGMVYDENQNKCWLKKCNCADAEVVCNDAKHETYYRKKNPPCPGAEYWDRNQQRNCYYSLFNFNLNSSVVFDWATSRKLCQDIFPVKSDIAWLETVEEFDYIKRNINMLRIPITYSRMWLGLSRPENVSDAWAWVNQVQTYSTNQPALPFTVWGPNNPSNGYEEQCVTVVLTPDQSRGEITNSTGQWADDNCRFKYPVLCKAKMPNFRNAKREFEARSDRYGDEGNNDEDWRPSPKK